MVNIGFIGAGTVGTALAVRLKEKGYPIMGVSSRSLSSAQRLSGMVAGCQVYERGQGVADNCDFVFITTPDDGTPLASPPPKPSPPFCPSLRGH